MGTVPAAFGGPCNPNVYEVNPLILSFLNLTHIRPFYSQRRPTLTRILPVNFAALHSRLSTWTKTTIFPHDRKAAQCQNFLFVRHFFSDVQIWAELQRHSYLRSGNSPAITHRGRCDCRIINTAFSAPCVSNFLLAGWESNTSSPPEETTVKAYLMHLTQCA